MQFVLQGRTSPRGGKTEDSETREGSDHEKAKRDSIVGGTAGTQKDADGTTVRQNVVTAWRPSDAKSFTQSKHWDNGEVSRLNRAKQLQLHLRRHVYDFYARSHISEVWGSNVSHICPCYRHRGIGRYLLWITAFPHRTQTGKLLAISFSHHINHRRVCVCGPSSSPLHSLTLACNK